MQKLFIVLFFLSVVFAAKSQNLQVEGTAPDLYVTHIVAPKENFYSIGRLYNQPPKSIAAYNNITMEKGLTIGQLVKIPLTSQNFDVTGQANAGETLIPVTHVVAKSETLFKIGTEHNVTAQLLRKWNNLSSDNIAPGTALVVGHLKVVNQSSSPVARTPTTTESVKTEVAVAKEEAPVEARKPENVQPKKTEASSVKEELFESVSPASNTKKDTAAVVSTRKEVVNQPAKETPVVAAEKRETSSELVGDISGSTSAREEEAMPQTNRKKESSLYSNTASIEGVFAGSFPVDASQKSLNSKSGDAATFKSVSGWQDKKYYVLMNDVAPGTILKISSADNKVVYAKVLGSMPDMKENNGLLLRISNAAASYLGIIDPKFPVKVSYYQ